MSHPRTQIRQALRTALTDLDTTGANVFVARSRRWSASELPGLAISAGDEVSLAFTPPLQVRSMDVRVDAVCRAAPGVDVDALLDQIALEVETAAYMDIALRATVIDLYLQSLTVDVSGELDQTLAVASMKWVLTYQVDVTNLEVIPGT